MFLAIRKGFEPLLLLPIGFGAVLNNIPNAGFTDPWFALLRLLHWY
ncbi:sodium ion-translocating decarboxylase subunit beta [Vibrio chagasii]|nr:sodium ion-translocating decarboxylase subunit beta [Vibrio chagasii]